MDIKDIIQEHHVNHMGFGMFNNKSYYGYKSSILKSGICKYYRRHLFDKYEWCVVEMMLFGIEEQGNKLVTNVWNRLNILIMEEIVCDEIDKICSLICLLGNIKTSNCLIEKIGYILKFCEISKICKKGRICSYINNWWKYTDTDLLVCDDMEIDKVLKYKKKEDSDELLKLGEKLIYSIENRDENIVGVMNKMFNLEGKYGRRYRRSDGVYLFWEIVQSYIKNKQIMKMFDFAFSNFNRKSMKERRYFGIWIGVIMWKCNFEEEQEDQKDIVEIKINRDEVIEYLKKRKNMKIDDDFVVRDYHVNRKFGLKKFGLVGSLVINEDLSLLKEKGELYKKFYVEMKGEEEKGNL